MATNEIIAYNLSQKANLYQCLIKMRHSFILIRHGMRRLLSDSIAQKWQRVAVPPNKKSSFYWVLVLEQVKDMLQKAFDRFPSVEGLILHSDQGWQYQHVLYQEELRKHKVIQSTSRKGNCYDNCIMETFFGRLKNEMFYGFEKEYTSFEIFAKAVSEYIDYYNNKRIQAKTKWMPPSIIREASIGQS